MKRRQCDVVVFGGGFAGLWILDRLVDAGYDAFLLESQALGEGQSIQAQGIIHGGGKYALRGVRDFSAVQAIREMPERWRRSLRGEQEPDLRSARILSEECNLWIPRSGFMSRVSAWGLMPLVRRAGLLHARPRRLPASQWPMALRDSARSVYAMAEPVVSTASALAALAARHLPRLLHYQAEAAGGAFKIYLKNPEQLTIIIEDKGVSEPLELETRSVVLAAGAGNEELLRRAQLEGVTMQRRPLRMVLVRGKLPLLYGHCVQGGKTAMTVTSHPLRQGEGVEEGRELVWQVGGEVAETHAGSLDEQAVFADARRQLFRLLPGVDLRGAEIASYASVRAEAESRRHRRPSGVHSSWVAPGVLVAWPTKMALSPVLGGEVLEEIRQRVGTPRPVGGGIEWTRPEVAADPWTREELVWNSVL